jgi:oxepin-CoA hydrolase/3-oxo-5,6-dehydrosuberyl-CoA semialdehyde dehydrogenase
MNVSKPDFVQDGFIELVKNLPADAPGKWGKMNAQQMVEHVTGFFMVSSGKLHFDLVTPAEHLPKFKEFLNSDKEFRENTKAPLSVIGEAALPLRMKNMHEAVEALRQNTTAFVDHFKDNRKTTTMHPVFGPLNFDEWILLHYKHLLHHAKQFGLVEA